MRDVFVNEESEHPQNERRLSARRHVPNFHYAFWTMDRERERAVRFSNLEIEVLVDLVKTHIIVEERRVDFSTNAVKKKAWETITNEFWTRTSSNRTEFQLLKKWKNLKHAARKYEAAINSKESVPGRGPPPRSPILEEVLDVIRREQEANSTRSIDTTVCLPTRIKVEQEDYHYNNTDVTSNRLCSDGDAHWGQEESIRTQDVAPPLEEPISLRLEEREASEPQNLVINRHPIPAVKQVKKTNNPKQSAECNRDCLAEAVPVNGCSNVSQETSSADSLVQFEAQSQAKENSGAESSDLSHLVHEKELALKAVQLAILEKENKIKELDIKIREEQLTDIIIRRKHEQELHELRKRRMLQGLSASQISCTPVINC